METIINSIQNNPVIFIVTLLTAALAIFAELKPKKSSYLHKAIFIVFILVLAGIQIYIQLKQAKELEKSQYSGILSVSPTPQPQTFVEYEIGDSKMSFVMPIRQDGNSSFLHELLSGNPVGKNSQITKENSLSISFKNGKLNVSAIIMSYDGKMVAEICNNEWKVNPQMAWDRNYTDDALEVRDNRGDVVLQLRLLPDRVRLQARFYDSQGNGVAFVKAPKSDGAFMEVLGQRMKQFTIPIVPLFKYPSQYHFGEFVDED